MRKNNTDNLIRFCVFVFVAAFTVTAITGYILNILNVFHSEISLTGKCVLQIAGVFIAPLGAILGLFP